VPRLQQLAAELGATKFQLSPEFLNSDTSWAAASWDRAGDGGSRCRLSRARSPQPVLAGRRRDAQRNGFEQHAHHAALALKAADAITDQLKHG